MKDNNLLIEKLKVLVKLNKIYITFAVGITTAVGYIVKKQALDPDMLWAVLGIFILACSSSVINHIQEERTDSLMERTQKRPIPAGEVSKSFAWWLASIEFIAAVLILYLFSGWLVLLLALTAFIWYNIIYTNLKKITAFAVIPGSIIGAIPPLVGWVAAGGSLIESNAIMLGLFFFIWQIPHFWMLGLHFASDYKKAGFPVLTDLFSKTQIRRQLFLMILGSSVMAIIMAFSSLVSSNTITIIILILSIGLVIQFSRLLNKKEKMQLNIHFRSINYYVLLVIILLCIDHLI